MTALGSNQLKRGTDFLSRFEPLRKGCDLTVAGYPLLIELLLDRLRDGEIDHREHERMAGFLSAEAAGSAEKSYPRSTCTRRRAEMRALGIAVLPGLLEPIKVDVRQVLDQALDPDKWDCA